MSAGGNHTCALTPAGDAYCWGTNDYGEIGDGVAIEVTTRSDPRRVRPTPVAGGRRFKAITAGNNHTCAITLEGAAYCWGSNVLGQLANGTVTQTCRHFFNGDSACSSTPVPVDSDLAFESIDAGANHTCALTSRGRAYCWGVNSVGQLGDGTTVGRTIPTAVAGGLSFQALSGGFLRYTCGLTVSGAIYCWGTGLAAGPQAAQASTVPVPVMAGMTFVAFSARSNHTCALGAGGDLSCWGSNQSGQLGDRSFVDRAAAVAVAGDRTFARVSTGPQRSCAITPSGQAYCWGSAFQGVLGTDAPTQPCVGGFESCLTEPAPVTGGLVFVAITLGDDHSCGLAANGAAYCWGENAYAQLGIDR